MGPADLVGKGPGGWGIVGGCGNGRVGKLVVGTWGLLGSRVGLPRRCGWMVLIMEGCMTGVESVGDAGEEVKSSKVVA